MYYWFLPRWLLEGEIQPQLCLMLGFLFLSSPSDIYLGFLKYLLIAQGALFYPQTLKYNLIYKGNSMILWIKWIPLLILFFSCSLFRYFPWWSKRNFNMELLIKILHEKCIWINHSLIENQLWPLQFFLVIFVRFFIHYPLHHP